MCVVCNARGMCHAVVMRCNIPNVVLGRLLLDDALVERRPPGLLARICGQSTSGCNGRAGLVHLFAAVSKVAAGHGASKLDRAGRFLTKASSYRAATEGLGICWPPVSWWSRMPILRLTHDSNTVVVDVSLLVELLLCNPLLEGVEMMSRQPLALHT